MTYLVLSPTYEQVIDIICDGQGPRETVRDYVIIEAATPREAKVLGLRELRRQWPRGFHNRYSDENPFTGMEVKPWTEDEAVS